MNYVIAIIQPHKLDAVRDALTKVGIAGLTVSDAQGYGRQKGHKEVYHGHEYTVSFVRKVKLEIACDEHVVDKVVDAIATAAKTDGGKVGDGKIFVFDLKETIRIRTGERGSIAI
ncbi:MAG TPA: P-II family nitrogen regulator [Planctomycetota bacterium]|nr:P-II family nitrogen regulator [Planctomycetota bacterium]